MQQISTQQLADWIAGCSDGHPRQPLVLLDVREPWEFEHCHLSGAMLIPMNALPARLNELHTDSAVVVLCHHGVRSMHAAMFLEQNGFSSIYNLAGGVNAWAHDIDPGMRKY